METSADNHDAAARVAALRPIRRPAPRRRGATRAQSRSLARSGKTGGFLGAPGLRFIPAVEVGGTREFLLQADDVVFVFLGSPRAIAHIFQAAWAERLVLKPGLLYLRTSWGLFWTRDFRALRGFKAAIPISGSRDFSRQHLLRSTAGWNQPDTDFDQTHVRLGVRLNGPSL